MYPAPFIVQRIIALGKIHLQHRASVYDARNKVRGLAQALGY